MKKKKYIAPLLEELPLGPAGILMESWNPEPPDDPQPIIIP